MNVLQLPVGDLKANAYIVSPEKSDEAMIIDPGGEADRLLEALGERKATKIVLTHGHYDHIGALQELLEHLGEVEVIAGRDELPMLADPMCNLSALFGKSVEIVGISRTVTDGDIIELGPLTFQVLTTPGHTEGGICLYAADNGSGGSVVFTGDTLFPDSIGRSDFPGGCAEKLLDSIHTKLFALPDECVVWSGHGGMTTIGREKQYNPFLK